LLLDWIGIMFASFKANRANAEAARRQCQSATFTEPLHVAPDEKAHLKQFLTDFYKSIYKKRNELSVLLRNNPGLEEQYQNLVPRQVSYEDFWQRYYWRCDANRILQEWERKDQERAAARSQVIADGLARVQSLLGDATPMGTNETTNMRPDEQNKQLALKVGDELVIKERPAQDEVDEAIVFVRELIASKRQVELSDAKKMSAASVKATKDEVEIHESSSLPSSTSMPLEEPPIRNAATNDVAERSSEKLLAPTPSEAHEKELEWASEKPGEETICKASSTPSVPMLLHPVTVSHNLVETSFRANTSIPLSSVPVPNTDAQLSKTPKAKSTSVASSDSPFLPSAGNDDKALVQPSKFSKGKASIRTVRKQEGVSKVMEKLTPSTESGNENKVVKSLPVSVAAKNDDPDGVMQVSFSSLSPKANENNVDVFTGISSFPFSEAVSSRWKDASATSNLFPGVASPPSTASIDQKSVPALAIDLKNVGLVSATIPETSYSTVPAILSATSNQTKNPLLRPWKWGVSSTNSPAETGSNKVVPVPATAAKPKKQAPHETASSYVVPSVPVKRAAEPKKGASSETTIDKVTTPAMNAESSTIQTTERTLLGPRKEDTNVFADKTPQAGSKDAGSIIADPTKEAAGSSSLLRSWKKWEEENKLASTGVGAARTLQTRNALVEPESASDQSSKKNTKRNLRWISVVAVGFAAIAVTLTLSSPHAMNGLCAPAFPSYELSALDARLEAPWWAPQPVKARAFYHVCKVARTRTVVIWELFDKKGISFRLSLLAVTHDGNTSLIRRDKRRLLSATIHSEFVSAIDIKGAVAEIPAPWKL
jgi:hypothetical protein